MSGSKAARNTPSGLGFGAIGSSREITISNCDSLTRSKLPRAMRIDGMLLRLMIPRLKPRERRRSRNSPKL